MGGHGDGPCAVGGEPSLTLLMRRGTRSKWHRPAPEGQPRSFRTQQYAPPAALPHETIVVHTAGDGDARRKDSPPPPAGYGFVAVLNGAPMYTVAGPIVVGVWPSIRTTTENLGALVAFTQACEWAAVDPRAMGKPVVIRYSNEYGAAIATGTWRARKHKAMASSAQAAWRRLRKASGGNAWILHEPDMAWWAMVARNLAARGKSGERIRTVEGLE